MSDRASDTVLNNLTNSVSEKAMLACHSEQLGQVSGLLQRADEQLPPSTRREELPYGRLVLRCDKARPSLQRETLLQNAPCTLEGLIVTPEAISEKELL